MKIFVSKVTFSVKIMNFSIETIKTITVVFVFVYNNKAVYEYEKTANLQ